MRRPACWRAHDPMMCASPPLAPSQWCILTGRAAAPGRPDEGAATVLLPVSSQPAAGRGPPPLMPGRAVQPGRAAVLDTGPPTAP